MTKKLIVPMHKPTKRRENSSNTKMRIVNGIEIVQEIKANFEMMFNFQKRGEEENVTSVE